MEKIKDININTVEYWDNFSTDVYQEADRNRGGNKCKFSTVRELLPLDVDILDVGCLNGNFYNFLKERQITIKSFTGIDFSSQLIKRAHLRFPEQTWIVSDCLKLPFDDKSFDVVTLMEILEHINSPNAAIKEACRVCKNKGFVIVTVPNGEKIKDAAHIWSYTVSDMFNMLFDISKNVQVLLTCSNNRNIVGKAIINYESYF